MVDLNSGTLTSEDKQRIYELDKILEKNPHDIPALLEKGFIFHEGCMDDEAIKVFKEILKIDPKNLDAYTWLCESIWMYGDSPQLKEVAQEALKIYPNQAVFYKFLAYSLEVVYYSQPEKIKELYPVYLKKAIELEPTWLSTRIALIEFLIKNKQFDEAKKEINEALKQILDNFSEPKNGMQRHYEELITGRIGYKKEDLDKYKKEIEEDLKNK